MRTLVNVLSSIPGGGSLVNGYLVCPFALPLPGVVGVVCSGVVCCGVVWVVVCVAEFPPLLSVWVGGAGFGFACPGGVAPLSPIALPFSCPSALPRALARCSRACRWAAAELPLLVVVSLVVEDPAPWWRVTPCPWF